MSTQKEMVLEYLKRNKKITDLEAYRDLSVRRLASRVHDLRVEGYNSRTEQTTKPNRYGKNTTFATYILED